MKLSVIMAMASNGTIGDSNKLPWHLPEDLKRFKKITTGHPIIMGRRTFESIGRVLPGRLNIIITRNKTYNPNSRNATVVKTLSRAVVVASETGTDEAFIIGGKDVFEQSLSVCDKIYLTLLEKKFEGDTKIDLKLDDMLLTHREYLNGTIPHQNIVFERIAHMARFITFERLENNDLPLPKYATELSAGVDFAACLTRPCKKVSNDTKTPFMVTDGKLTIAPGETILIPLGFKCEISQDCCMKLYIRSSVGIRGIVLANSVGIIDADYRGDLYAAVKNQNNYHVTIEHGERIVQGILTPYHLGIITEGKVDTTERGEGGLGSTGK